MRPRALALLSRLPWPLDDGGRIALYQDAASLSRCANTVLLALVPPGQTETPLPRPLTELGIRFVRIEHRPPGTPRAVAEGLIGTWPHTLARFRNAGFERAVRREVEGFDPDFVYFSSLHMATYADALGARPMVLRQQNVEHLWLSRLAPTFGNPLARAYTRYQAGRMRRTEARLCSRMALVLAIHEPEAAALRVLVPDTRVEVVPIGVDPGRFTAHAAPATPIVLVAGTFGWAPNLHGLKRFLEQGWPALRALAPGATLRVVGRDLPIERLRPLAGERSELVGYVERMEPELARASLLLVPLWSGAGIRVKIVEAMMSGTPVVATPLGAEGLEARPEREIVLAESPAELAREAAALLADPVRAAAIGAAGREFARQRFTLDAVARRTGELCLSVLPHSDARGSITASQRIHA
jgi:glycosyltransferase involved in cell wall biosynthesis